MNDSLLELLQIGGKKNYEFHLKVTEEKVNLLTLDNENKIIDVTIGDPENKDLSIMITDIIEQLK